MPDQIQTSIDIEASAEDVFDIITDLEGYKRWNPFIVSSAGKALAGERLINTMKNGERTMTFKPVVLVAQRPYKFEWLGSLWFRGLFDGHHYFHIEETKAGWVRLVHGEHFSGLLAGFILKRIKEQTRDNFIAMNEAIKKKMESK